MRALRRLLVVSLVLVVLLVVADRVAAWAAQRAVADQVANELTESGVESAPPEVSFDRVPFLTQVAAGRYGSVTLRLRDVGTGPVRLPMVELTASGVTASVDTLLRREGSIRAERVDGAVTVGYGTVVSQAGLDDLELAGTPDGELRVRLPSEALGVPVALAGRAEVSVLDGAVALRVTELTVVEPADPPAGAEALAAGFAEQLSVTVPLPPLPYGLALESVSARPAGLVVRVSATDVPLAR